jgi:hypothetical protein
MTLRVTIDGIPASWTCDGGWRCNDDLVSRKLLAACEPDTAHAHEATALAKAVRHFPGVDRVVVVELGTDDEDAALLGRTLIQLMDPRGDGDPLPSDPSPTTSPTQDRPGPPPTPDPPFPGAGRSPQPDDDTFERDLVERETSRQENATARLRELLARRSSQWAS